MGITSPFGGISAHDIGGVYHIADTRSNVSGKISDAAIFEIKSGTYTGDGAVSQGITGVGFQPVFVMIWRHETGTGDSIGPWVKTDQMSGALCQVHTTAGNYHKCVDNAVISLDADGFTVDDAGADTDPNTNTQVYDYIALG